MTSAVSSIEGYYELGMPQISQTYENINSVIVIRIIFGQPVKIFSKEEIVALIKVASQYQFELTSELDLSVESKPVSWFGLDYTFLILTMRKKD